jgi:SAM-dependent methyltransferase
MEIAGKILRKLLRLKYLEKYLPVKPYINPYIGNNVHCNLCDGNFITFLPFGLIKRANAQCPGCGSLERHRLSWHYILNQTDLLTSNNVQRLMHVAPETVIYNKLFGNQKIDYVPCVKIGEDEVDEYPTGTIDVDITNVQFGDNSFDAIYCSHVLEHVPEDVKAMKEFFRILKPGGWAMLQVPIDKSRSETYEDFSITDPKEREKAFGQFNHVRLYGMDYIDRLKLAGFEVNPIPYAKSFTQGDIFRNGFDKEELLFICKKNNA